MNKSTKLALSLSSITTIALPISVVVSCSYSNENPNYKPSEEMRKKITEEQLQTLQKNYGKISTAESYQWKVDGNYLICELKNRRGVKITYNETLKYDLTQKIEKNPIKDGKKTFRIKREIKSEYGSFEISSSGVGEWYKDIVNNGEIEELHYVEKIAERLNYYFNGK